MTVKEESEKTGLKLRIQKTKIMVSGPMSSWWIDWEKVETVADFIFLSSKITADHDCSHENWKTLAPWKKIYDKPRQCRYLKAEISLWWKMSAIVKAMVFPVVMYGCENLTINKAEHWRIDAFKLWCCTMEYYSAIKKNSFESVLMRWMKLESIIQGEVSQKDKDQYSILTHIYGI